jgi:uncharacterized phiE125 gp8 family phage protein
VTIERTVAPLVTPVSLQEAKDHLRVTHDDEDALITSFIDAATDHFDGDGTLGRAMVTQSWAQWVSQSPGPVRLRMGPFQDLTSIEYFDSENALQTATLANFETWRDGDFVLAKPRQGFSWPTAYSRPDAIKITYQAGFGDEGSDVPQSIRHALLLTVGHFYENREATTDMKIETLPMAVEALISNHRVGWYG